MTGHGPKICVCGVWHDVSSWQVGPGGILSPAPDHLGIRDWVENHIITGLSIPQGIFTGATNYSNAPATNQWKTLSADELRNALVRVREEMAKASYVAVAESAIERRLPADFKQGRLKLATALAEAEYDFQKQLASWAEKHHVPVR